MTNKIAFMGKAISYDVRHQIVNLHKSGKTYSEIATETGVSIPMVNKLMISYRRIGEAAYENKYHNSGRKSGAKFESHIVDEVLSRATKNQGGPFVYSVLIEENPDVKIPHYRTIQRWWLRSGKRIKKEKKLWTQSKMD